MPNLPLVFAGCDYPERAGPIIDGTVKIAGVDLTWLVEYPGDLFRRMLQFEEFDAAEMSISFYMALVSRGDKRFVGVPVFPIRHFRHGYIFVRNDAGINVPKDLIGKRIGMPEYPMTAALWIRAILHHEYGVTAPECEWFQGGFETPGFASRFPLEMPSEIHVTTIPDNKSLVGMLMDGEIDAIIGPGVPSPVKRGDPRVRRLLPNYRELERDYYQRTGFFPMDHTVVIRREIYEKNRWLPMNILKAFQQANDLGWNRFVGHGYMLSSLPWFSDELEEMLQIFGGNPYQYGYKQNLPLLEAVTQYTYEQGVATRKIDPAEMFAPETLQGQTH